MSESSSLAGQLFRPWDIWDTWDISSSLVKEGVTHLRQADLFRYQNQIVVRRFATLVD